MRLGRAASAQPMYETPHALVSGSARILIDQVLPDRLRGAPQLQRSLDRLAVRLTGAGASAARGRRDRRCWLGARILRTKAADRSHALADLLAPHLEALVALRQDLIDQRDERAREARIGTLAQIRIELGLRQVPAARARQAAPASATAPGVRKARRARSIRTGEPEPQARLRRRLYARLSSLRAMIRRWISDVPAPISMSLASRAIRSTGYSRV
jgi:hypothetical protein